MASSVEIQLQQIMDEYQIKVQTVARGACRKVAGELGRTLRSTSPKSPGGGEYASGWGVKVLNADTWVVYNKKKPGLTHLLEKGHIVVNKYGVVGRAPAYPHIKPAADAAQEELITEIEARL